MFGQMVPTIGNSVLVVYEKESWAYTYFYHKELWVVGYSPDGVQIGPEVQLMNPYTIGGSYCHYVVPDGDKGGYAYMWHAGIGEAFNTYIFHFDEYGNSTISDLNGIPVHFTDPSNYYLDAYGTVDPVSHDLIIAYQVKDATTQSQDHIYMNRITSTGDKVWGEGILVADYTGVNYSEIKVDAFEDGSGFSIIYMEDEYVQAKGFDMEGNLLWSKQISSSNYNKSFCENSTSFHIGQNIVAWVNSSNGNVYGQNIAPDGTMGPVEPPVITCLPPENFEGEYFYNMEEEDFGVNLTWTAPESQPLHYNLYRSGFSVKETEVIEVDGNATSYYDSCGMGSYKYQLTAVYDDCESEYALTPLGEDYVIVVVTSISENTSGDMVTILRIFNANGQALSCKHLEELDNGLYILQGLTEDGRIVNRKIMVNK